MADSKADSATWWQKYLRAFRPNGVYGNGVMIKFHVDGGIHMGAVALAFVLVACDSADNSATSRSAEDAKLSERTDFSNTGPGRAKLSERPEQGQPELSDVEKFESALSDEQLAGLEELRAQTEQWYVENPQLVQPKVPDEQTMAILREQMLDLAETNPERWTEYYKATVRDHLGPEYFAGGAAAGGGLNGDQNEADGVSSDDEADSSNEATSLNEKLGIDPIEAKRQREEFLRIKEQSFPKSGVRDRKFRVGQ